MSCLTALRDYRQHAKPFSFDLQNPVVRFELQRAIADANYTIDEAPVYVRACRWTYDQDRAYAEAFDVAPEHGGES